MRAVLFRQGTPVVEELPDPVPAEGEAIVRVNLAGICGTDLEIARGYMSFAAVPGHEFVGVVESAPEEGWAGKRVVGEINVPCGACEICRKALGASRDAERDGTALLRHCARRTVLGIAGRNGAFAERLALPIRNLHVVPRSVADDAAVFTEPLAAAHEILEQVRPGRDARALVLGDGRLGQLCAAVLERAGCPPLVVGRHRAKRERLERRGLRTVDESAALERDFDPVIEATGSPEGLRRALRLVRPRGTVVLKSTYHGEAPFALAGLVVDEITVIGSRCGPFAPALEHLASDPSLTEGLVSARFPMSEVAAAFTRAAAPDALKVLLEI